MVEKGAELPAGCNPSSMHVIPLSPLVLHRWRRRFNMEFTKGSGKTSVDPVTAMGRLLFLFVEHDAHACVCLLISEASFESLGRCLTARYLGVKQVSNTDQTMVLVYDDAKDSGYAAPRTGQSSGTQKRSGGRERLTICSEVCNGRFPSVMTI